MATALLMMPISILLAVVLPGNRFLPFSDLVLYPFVFAMVVPICKGNIVRSVIVGTCVMTIGLYVATYVSDAFTTAGLMGGLTGLQPEQLASSVVDGATWVGAALKFLFGLLPH
jgi:PTS system galactitol-specific IIC component